MEQQFQPLAVICWLIPFVLNVGALILNSDEDMLLNMMMIQNLILEYNQHRHVSLQRDKYIYNDGTNIDRNYNWLVKNFLIIKNKKANL